MVNVNELWSVNALIPCSSGICVNCPIVSFVAFRHGTQCLQLLPFPCAYIFTLICLGSTYEAKLDREFERVPWHIRTVSKSWQHPALTCNVHVSRLCTLQHACMRDMADEVSDIPNSRFEAVIGGNVSGRKVLSI